MDGGSSSTMAGVSSGSPGPSRRSGSPPSRGTPPEQTRYIPRSYRARKVPPNEGRGPRGRRGHPDASPHGQSSEAPSPGGRKAISPPHAGGTPRGGHLGGGGPHRLARPPDPREPWRRPGLRSLDRVRRADRAARNRPCDRMHAVSRGRPVLERERRRGGFGGGARRDDRLPPEGPGSGHCAGGGPESGGVRRGRGH